MSANYKRYQRKGFDERSIGAKTTQPQLNSAGRNSDQRRSLRVSSDNVLVYSVGQEDSPPCLNISARKQDNVSSVEKRQVLFREAGRNHSAVGHTNAFHRRYEYRVEIRVVTVRGADVGCFQIVSVPLLDYSVQQKLSVLTVEKKLTIGKQKDRWVCISQRQISLRYSNRDRLSTCKTSVFERVVHP